MNNLFKLFLIAGTVLAASCSGELGGRIDQHPNVPKPTPVTVKSVRSISGGAIIKVTIPDDPNLKGVMAVYDRNGVEVSSKISRYVDSLTVAGFPDTKEHTINIYSFNVNEECSEPVSVNVTPLTPAIVGVKPSMEESSGGIKIHIQNNIYKTNIAICILRCDDPADFNKPSKDIKWVEVTTLFTSSEDIVLSRRGIEPKEAIFGLYLRDYWGNVSDTTTAVLTPIEEIKLDASKFTNADLEDDTCRSENASYYPISSLWDGSGQSATPHFFASEKGGPSPTWLTIDLGVKAKLARITTLPRIGYNPFKDGAVRDYEFWGSMSPTGKLVEPTEDNPNGFDETWFCLGKFTQIKPSGYLPSGLVGEITPDDGSMFNSGNDFEFDKDKYPRCYDEVRYLRVVFANTFATFELGHGISNRQVQTGEVTPFGRVLESYR